MAQRSTSPASLAQHLLDAALSQGFDLAAVLPIPPSTAREGTELQAGLAPWVRDAASRYLAWLDRGRHGEMAYLARPEAISCRLDPAKLLPGLRSVLIVGINYHSPPPAPSLNDPSRGIISSHAWGKDYHGILSDKLEAVARSIRPALGWAAGYRVCVDTAPFLEREFAAKAGLGFLGKNTCLISPRTGSWLFLGELLLTVELPPLLLASGGNAGTASTPLPSCGRCSRCLDACPTGALVAPHTLDARRCIAYLTIEQKGPMPLELRRPLGNRIFGCDACQAVCPWNTRLSRPTAEPAFSARSSAQAPHLLELMTLDATAFASRFADSPVWRAKRRGLLRNTAVALGNWGSSEAIPALAQALHDPEPLVRGHAAWALGCIGTPFAHRALTSALHQEGNPWVRSELGMALSTG